ncbi:hypothetical protein, partial [Xanthovirga aplysinae]|uniref:hypothetical protein n=1 Tax=Xanthovirga aplysinae TaxID=2529853 RepID=UPI0012BD7449
MRKKINTLIIDDNPVIGDCIGKRILKANSLYIENPEIVPTFMEMDLTHKIKSLKLIEGFILNNQVEILLLDRGYYRVYDPVKDEDYKNLNDKYLYSPSGDKGMKIENLLSSFSAKSLNKIKGIIIYTYDSDE